MTITLQNTAYDAFAWLFNRQWGPHALRVLPLLDALALTGERDGTRVLDLCCGTGQLARALGERGLPVTGLDASAEMLRYAREHAPQAELLLADARDFSLPPAYRVAVAGNDSLNHLLSLDDLAAALRNVRHALLPGGRFLFDLNMRDGYLQGWNRSWEGEEEDCRYTVRTEYDDDARLGRFAITIHPLQDGRQHSDLTLLQRCYDEAEVIETVLRAGFRRLDIHDHARPPHAIPLPPGRAYFLATA